MKWAINDIEIIRATRGTHCRIGFLVKTQRQFTWEWHKIDGGSPKHGLLGFILAALDTWWAARNEASRLVTLPGKFAIDG